MAAMPLFTLTYWDQDWNEVTDLRYDEAREDEALACVRQWLFQHGQGGYTTIGAGGRKRRVTLISLEVTRG